MILELATGMPAVAGDPRSSMQVMSPTEYYKRDVADADAQFDHQETTLSHLLRVPHPAQVDRGQPELWFGSGRVRQHEQGAGSHDRAGEQDPDQAGSGQDALAGGPRGPPHRIGAHRFDAQ